MATNDYGSTNNLIGALFLKIAVGDPKNIDSVSATLAAILLEQFPSTEITPAFGFLKDERPNAQEIEAQIKKYTKLYLSIGQFTFSHRFGPQLLEAIVKEFISKNGLVDPVDRKRWLKSLVRRFTHLLSSPSAIEEARQYFQFNGSGRLDFQNNLLNLLEDMLSNVYLARAV